MKTVLETFMTPRERDVFRELPRLEGQTFSRAADGRTTRKRVLLKLRDAGLVAFDRGEPLRLTDAGRGLF